MQPTGPSRPTALFRYVKVFRADFLAVSILGKCSAFRRRSPGWKTASVAEEMKSCEPMRTLTYLSL
jgi:hypothetical protein